MQVGMIGLGKMGANMVRRLRRGGCRCVVYDAKAENVLGMVAEGIGVVAAGTVEQFVEQQAQPRVVWMMVPAAVVDHVLSVVGPMLSEGDIVVDGGNSYYHDDIRRAGELKAKGIHYVDVGVSGGVWGLERGYCLMVGGEQDAVAQLEEVLAVLAPGVAAAARTEGRAGPARPAEKGYLHCGPVGAGYFVKMVHNGIEYGLMAAYAEGLNVLKHANAGKQEQVADAETTPLRQPEMYQYDLDVGEIAELWRRGSVIGSWLLDLTAGSLLKDGELQRFSTRVADSGEGRWTIAAALDEAVPTPVLSAALYERFSSRGEAEFADRLLSAMRWQFGGHVEKG